MAEESPVIEEQTTETEEEQVPDTENLIEELKAAGVTNAQELQNKLKASAEVGNMAYKLGEERKEKAELLERLTSLESKITQSSEDDYSTDYGKPVDLQAEVRKAFRAERDAERKEAQQQQQNMMASWNRIQNDKDFHLVKPIWDEKLKDPNFVYSVQSGQVNPVEAYQETLRDYYKGIVSKSAETIEKLTGGKVRTPVVEQGSSTAALPEEDEKEQDKVLGKLQKKIDTGGQLTEAEELAALQASFSK